MTHRTAGGEATPMPTTATGCALSGNPLTAQDGTWIDPSVPQDAAPELCLLNEERDDTFGPHQPTAVTVPSDQS